MRTQKLQLTFSTDTHIHTDLATPRTSVPIVSIETHIHTSFIVKLNKPTIYSLINNIIDVIMSSCCPALP